jgi:hypothetical protein
MNISYISTRTGDSTEEQVDVINKERANYEVEMDIIEAAVEVQSTSLEVSRRW